MKKIFLILTFMILTSAMVFAAAKKVSKYTDIFVFRFNFCIPYSETVTLEDGTTISRNIIYWQNSLCPYNEMVKTEEGSKYYSCLFSRANLDELVATMRKDHNGGGASDKLWDKYRKDTNVCKSAD